MHLTFRGVNDAFSELILGIHSGRIPTEVLPSRYGEVLAVEEPVTITYTRPRERVLFNAARDANPFFHLYESLWMLAGRNDVAPLAYYCSRMPEFSDDCEVFNGAYGHRWRSHPRRSDEDECEYGPVDQIQLLVDHLRAKPESRRAVLQMWTVEDDLLEIDTSRDVCCNTCVYFAVEYGMCKECDGVGWTKDQDRFGGREAPSCPACNGMPHERPRYLNMTVCNRSNDLTWGLLGSNYVCFSILQEYVAAQLGLDVEKYHHFTNNLHAYTNRWHPCVWLDDKETDRYVKWPCEGSCPTVPLVKNPAMFDQELPKFVGRHASGYRPEELAVEWQEPFFRDVAQPLLIAFACYKAGDFHGAYQGAAHCEDGAWRAAAESWLRRRERKRKNRALASQYRSSPEQRDEEGALPQAYQGYDPDLAV